MKLALVHDDLIQHGGAERLFCAIHEIWPEAPIFTSMASDWWLDRLAGKSPPRKTASLTSEVGSQETSEVFPAVEESGGPRQLCTSFMQHLPFKKKLYRAYLPLYPLAFESFDFSDFDVVLSSSTRFAHGVITRPETIHICYMNSPGRMFWEPENYFREKPRLAKILAPLLTWLRCWDFSAAQRVDYFIANSKSVQAKIRKYYGRDSKVIYPFVELERFKKRITSYQLPVTSYYLIVSRLTTWKRIDIAIEACNELKLPLVIVGEGPDRRRLERSASPTVKFLGRLSDEGVVKCYQDSSALIFPQREDFGITPLEAMASGKPVLAYKAGGALETVLPGETGEFFYPQTAEALAKVLSDFRPERFSSEVCRKQAAKFSKERFQKELKSFVEETYEKHTRLL